MKKKLILCALTAVVAAAALRTVPRVVETSIPSIYYITPSVRSYENTVSCNGTVQSQNVQEVYLQSVVVGEEVLVSIGDHVREGDLLLTVNREKTGGMGTGVSLQEGIPGVDVSGLDLSSLISAYGLSSILGMDLDLGGIASLLSGQGEADGAQSATAAAVLDADEDVTAPISGIVTEVNVLPGVPVSAGKSILTITDNGRYKVMAAVGEADVSRLEPGDIAHVRGVGFAGSSYRGVVSKIYPTARKTLSGASAETVVDVEILLENPDENLRPGFSAKVEIVGGNRYEMITVPYEAIRQDENNSEYVYTYEDGKLCKTPVITGQELTDEVEILEGLQVDSVVIYNPDDVDKEGSIIHIKGRADID